MKTTKLIMGILALMFCVGCGAEADIGIDDEIVAEMSDMSVALVDANRQVKQGGNEGKELDIQCGDDGVCCGDYACCGSTLKCWNKKTGYYIR